MSLCNKQLSQCEKMGDRTANTEKQQCQTNSSFTREYNKCRGMEETTECLQRGKYQTKEKSNFSDYYFFITSDKAEVLFNCFQRKIYNPVQACLQELAAGLFLC